MAEVGKIPGGLDLLPRGGRVGINQDIVLVGFKDLLPPAFAAQSHQAIGQGRGAEFFFPDFQDFAEQAVINFGDDIGEVKELGFFLEQQADDIEYFPGQGDQPRHGLLIDDVVGEGNRRGPLEEHQVMVGDNPLQAPLPPPPAGDGC